MKQTQALSVMLAGEPVFLTGPPGAGKTYVLNQFIKRAVRQGKTVAVTASTGIAATHIGGTTIHSWSGLGIRDELLARDRQQMVGNGKLVKRYNGTDVLVIDEVSMLHGKRLDMVNAVCKLLRKGPRPFGGLQVILVGDLFQLPPVTRGSDIADFAHTSAAWQELEPKICYLSEQHRQQQDGLLDLLEAMRRGELEIAHQETIQSRLGKQPADGEPVTRLYAHNIDIDTINNRHLAALQEKIHEYEIETSGSAAKVEQLRRSILAPELLELKVGAEVMFVANNPGSGYVNGTRGKVIGFNDDKPLVQLVNGRKISVTQHSWKLEEDGRVRAEVSQLPLRLAWAITIHKSQGMSLDAAEIDLSRSFTPGMGYVALSRVRSLEGLYLAGVNNMALRMHPDIYELDESLRRSSSALAAITSEVEDNVPDEEPVTAVINQPLLTKLKQWRTERARADSVPPYMVAHDALLELIATKMPNSNQVLLGMKGLGPRKIEQYGDDILKLTAAYLTDTDVAVTIGNNEPQGWAPAEDALLLNIFKQGRPLDEVCAMLGRGADEVWSRLHHLTHK